MFSALRTWLALLLNRTSPQNSAQRRYQRIGQAVITGFLGRGLIVVVNLIAVRLAINYLGAERYGAWMAISSLLVWITIADFGLGNGLTNALSKAYANENEEMACRAVTTAFWLLVIISFGLWLALGSVALLVDWGWVLNVKSPSAQSEINLAVFVALFITLLGFPFSVVERVYRSFQEGAIANYWSSAGSVLSIIALVIATRANGDLVWLVLAFSGMGVLVQIASAIYLFGFHRRWLMPNIAAFDRENWRALANASLQLFVLQIAALIVLQTDNIVIARVLGAEAVTPYSVTWRLFSYATLALTFTLPALWPAYAEAIARGDIAWIRHAFYRSTALNLIITSVITIVLIVAGQMLVRLWTGREEAVAPWWVFIWMGLWGVINVVTNSTATLMSGVGRLKGQMVYGTTTAIVNLILSILLAQRYGITGVIAATVIAYLVCNIIPSIIESYFILYPRTAPTMTPTNPTELDDRTTMQPESHLANDDMSVSAEIVQQPLDTVPYAQRVSSFQDLPESIPVINTLPPEIMQAERGRGWVTWAKSRLGQWQAQTNKRSSSS
jgi:O-antigen/teichoic acid export membrane protein